MSRALYTVFAAMPNGTVSVSIADIAGYEANPKGGSNLKMRDGSVVHVQDDPESVKQTLALIGRMV